MAAVYEDNFGYYDLKVDPDEAAFFAFVKSPEQPAQVPALLRAGQVAAGAQDLRAMLRRDGIRRPPSETETRLPSCGGWGPDFVTQS